MPKFIFVTGGVVSGLGKGITAASIGTLLKARGYHVSIIKMDPYVNVDAGNMNPLQHGEVFVTDDGAETDLDLGHYERFIDRPLSAANNVTTGQVYGAVIKKERAGLYEGKTVQVIPHVTNEIKERLMKAADLSKAEIIICEIGGTVGDIESLPFLEAIRQIRTDLGGINTVYVHVTLVPYLAFGGEQKTKPTQHSVAELRSIGIAPDIIIPRSTMPLSREMRQKISLFCSVEEGAVIQNLDAKSIYEFPVRLEKEGLGTIIEDKLGLLKREPDLKEWEEIADKIVNPDKKCTVALVGNYVNLHDAYKSTIEALAHGGLSNRADVRIEWVDSKVLGEAQDEKVKELLSNADGIIVPAGSGNGGVGGKIKAVKYAKDNKVPFFGICMGFCCIAKEGSLPVKEDMEKPKLGLHPCRLKERSLAKTAYGEDEIEERHRHKSYVSLSDLASLKGSDLWVSGEGEGAAQILELKGHPWFLGTQFRPELRSRPNRPHPLFKSFIEAALRFKGGH